MIKNNSLADRLNAIKQGMPLPSTDQKEITHELKPNQQMSNIEQPSFKTYIISKLLSLVDTFLASFLYGYAIKTIFYLNWNLLGIFAVGFLLNHIVSVFPKFLFPKYFK